MELSYGLCEKLAYLCWKEMGMVVIEVVQGGSRTKILAERGVNLLELLIENGYSIDSPCGGKGICGKCKIRVLADKDKYGKKYQLACHTTVEEDLVVEIPERKKDGVQIMTSGQLTISTNSSIKKSYIELTPPSIDDQISDVARIDMAMAPARVSNELIADVPDILRLNNFKVTAVMYYNTIIGIEPGNTEDISYGIAIDVGTTTIVGFLMELNTGEELGRYSSLNPQSVYGADVMTRIDYTVTKLEGLSTLGQLLRDEINNMIYYFCTQYEISAQDIYEIVFVGNTIMMHILAGIPIKNIASSPFIPVVCKRLELASRDLELKIYRHGRAVILPMISGYVGADTVAAILNCGMHRDSNMSLLIDIGTNGEIALGNSDGISVCSTAAGPTFEGASIECGLGGISGAINRVYIEDDVRYTTIGGLPPKGICGSGIVDTVAQMLKSGILDKTGRIISPTEEMGNLSTDLNKRLVLKEGQPAFLLTTKRGDSSKDIYISQKDIREVQLAKGAIRAGIEVLMKDKGISYSDVSNVYLAGGFGNYIDCSSAMDIGLIPKEFNGKIVEIGNAAGVGAKMALLSKNMIEEADTIKGMADYVELSSSVDFQTYFIKYLDF